MLRKLLIFLVCGLSFFVASGAISADRSAEVDGLIGDLNSNVQIHRINAAKIISRSGFRDAALYQQVAQLLEEGYAKEYETMLTDEMSWMCKALAASGDPRYKALLEKVVDGAPSFKLKNYAQQSLDLFERYAERNQILNATERWDPALSDEDNRLMSMLASADVPLRRDAAKIIYRKSGTDPKVFARVAEVMLQMAGHNDDHVVHEDTIAWLAKALSVSGNKDYLKTIEEIKAATDSDKVHKHLDMAAAALS